MAHAPASTSASHRGKLRGNPVWSGLSGATLAARESDFTLIAARQTLCDPISPQPSTASRPSAERNDYDYDVLAVVGRIMKARAPLSGNGSKTAPRMGSCMTLLNRQ